MKEKNMITIKKIEWVDDVPRGEAHVTVTDGRFKLICFSYPCEFTEGQKLTEEISTFLTDNEIKSLTKNYSIEKKDDAFDYYLTAKVIDKSKGIVAIGDIPIHTYNIPEDISEGDFISFYTMRLDL